MAATSPDGFDRLVDHLSAEARGCLSTQLQEEIIIRKIGLRDGIYRSEYREVKW